MNINKIFSIGLAAIALAACTAEPLRNPDMDKQANLPGAPKDVEDGVVIVKFSAAALPSVEAAAEKFMATKSSEMPTSGIPSVDEIFERINVTGLVRVFPSDKAHEAATKAVGPESIGLTRAQVRKMTDFVQLMRWRINLFDLCKRARLYDELMDRVFVKGVLKMD